jgi:hypothetical protein
MRTVEIPKWNAYGVLPPFNEEHPTSFERSPYLVNLEDVIERFGTSSKRKSLLENFLRFRNKIHNAGLISGFQWLNGSFLENVDANEHREPNDIDVVTFYRLPENQTQQKLLDCYPDVFENELAKKEYLVDSYFVELRQNDLGFLIRNTTYWYSIWSHRRNYQWKGFLEVEL